MALQVVYSDIGYDLNTDVTEIPHTYYKEKNIYMKVQY